MAEFTAPSNAPVAIGANITPEQISQATALALAYAKAVQHPFPDYYDIREASCGIIKRSFPSLDKAETAIYAGGLHSRVFNELHSRGLTHDRDSMLHPQSGRRCRVNRREDGYQPEYEES